MKLGTITPIACLLISFTVKLEYGDHENIRGRREGEQLILCGGPEVTKSHHPKLYPCIT